MLNNAFEVNVIQSATDDTMDLSSYGNIVENQVLAVENIADNC